MAKKKIKLEGEVISVILVADTNSESSAEASDVENDFEEEEEEGGGGGGPQAATNGRLPTWGPP